MHPRNRHLLGLDFNALIAASPELKPFVRARAAAPRSPPDSAGQEANMKMGQAANLSSGTLDFADPLAQRALAAALLKLHYGVAHWELPAGYLCPSIPGRADYVHTAADLLAPEPGGEIPRGRNVRVLDVGVGANCVYPLLGRAEYGWRFLGSDIDPVALAAAQQLVDRNGLAASIELRLQASPTRTLGGLLQPGDLFALVLCNPPFHESAQAAAEGSLRKWKNLGRAGPRGATAASDASAPPLNFGGQGSELWCPGGEVAFVKRLIDESTLYPKRCVWFTALISKQEHLRALEAALKKTRAVETRILEMKQGQKTSRVIAWTFLTQDERRGAR